MFMRLDQQYSLQSSNSFQVESTTPIIYYPESLSDLQQLAADIESPFYIIGEGSNILFVDQQAPVIIKPLFHGIEIQEQVDSYLVTVGAAENWHDLVVYCVNKSINGLENLALIPGSVGAAPVQNIGAYGVEMSDFCHEVEYFDLATKTSHTFTTDQCQFSYRNSVFKKQLHGRAVITKIVFSFPKQWHANLSYNGLDHLPVTATAQEVMAQVIKVRQQKLPDPTNLPNAGSFFKNPVVNNETVRELKHKYPNIPVYPQTDTSSKLAAGWLIEQSGLKGYKVNGVGVHDNQALVLVNYQSANGQDILNLARYVQEQVHKKFNILLTPEVRLITKHGEKAFTELCL